MFNAYGRYLVIEPFERSEVTAGGIIIKSEEDGEYHAGRGKVLSVGDEVKGLKAGDIIRFKQHHEHELDPGIWSLTADAVIAIEND